MPVHVSKLLLQKSKKVATNFARISSNKNPKIFADISKEKWEKMMAGNKWNTIDLRDNRYNQIVHMVSAANGAEDFYSTEVSLLFVEVFFVC